MATAPLGAVVRYLRTAGPNHSDHDCTDEQLLERFLTVHDEGAFTTLVHRHGPMVLGVCRHVLRHQQDAEDAFQVTFLVLARHAATVRKREALAGWLHGVAYRTALQARRSSTRRRRHEARVEAMTPKAPPEDPAWKDVQEALDEEIGRLPPTYRVPFVLCCVEGRSRAEAATELGLSDGTVSSRLARARKRLQTRLARRGISLAAALAALAVAREAGAAVPPSLLRRTVRAALGFAGGAAAAGVLSPSAADLLQAVSRSLFLAKCRTLLGVLVFVAALTAGGGVLLFRAPAAEPPGAAEPKDPPPAVAAAAAEKDRMTVRGSVCGADGRPVADAAVAVVARPRRQVRSGDLAAERQELLGEGRTGADGRFRFAALRTSSARYGEVFLVAAARGHGIDWQRLGPDVERPESDLRLPPEQVIHGRLLDLQGVPAAHVRVTVQSLGGMVRGEWHGISLAALPKRAPWPVPVTTDDRGRFEVRGCNRDREVRVRVNDERFAVQWFEIVARGKRRPPRTAYGLDAAGYLHTDSFGGDEKGQAEEPAFTLTPAHLLQGRVVYDDTGKPAAGASVLGVKTTADGRFQIPLGAAGATTLEVFAPPGQPYLSVFSRVEWPKGATRHEVEVRLPRGVRVRGWVTEAGSGRPVAGAGVQFWPRGVDRTRHLITGYDHIEPTGADGTFTITVPPGAGYLLVQGPTPDYVHQELDSHLIFHGRRGGSRFYPDAALPLDVPARGEPKEVALTLRRGTTVRGRLLGPDGKPVAWAVQFCRLHVSVDLSWHFTEEARGGVFEVHGLDPEKEVPVYFLDPVKQCGAVVNLSGKQAGQDVVVKLAPCGRATARYLDANGKPLVNYQAAPDLVVTPGRSTYPGDDAGESTLRADEGSLMNLDRDNYWDGVKTDARGRVTFPALIPGATYRVGRFEKDHWTLHREFRVESGRTVDLGDVVNRKE